MVEEGRYRDSLGKTNPIIIVEFKIIQKKNPYWSMLAKKIFIDSDNSNL